MNVTPLLTKMDTLEIRFTLQNGEMVISAPEGVLTEKRLEILRKHKTEIIDAKFPLDAMETAFIEKWKGIFGNKRVDFLDLRELAEEAGYLTAPRPPSSLQRIQATFDKLVASGQARRVGGCGLKLRISTP